MTAQHLFEAIRETGREYQSQALRGIVARAQRFEVIYPEAGPVTEDQVREIIRQELDKQNKPTYPISLMSLLDIIKQTLDYITGLRSSRDNLKAELDTANATIQQQSATITDLKNQVDQDKVDDEALAKAAADAEQAARDATDRADKLQQEIDDTQKAADELSAAINEHPDAPNVGPNLQVVEPEPVPE